MRFLVPLPAHPRKRNFSKRGFTLIELLIVIAILGILTGAVVVALNPAELLKQARDAERFADLGVLNKALALYQADSQTSLGSATTTYVSIPDTSPTCANLGLPTLPSGYGYACATSANLQKIDGTGWVPINLGSLSFYSPLGKLPIDPVNTTSSGQFYTYTPGGSWELTSAVESTKYRGIDRISGKDGGDSYNSFEIGTNLALAPIQIQELGRDSALTGYWPLDGGSGTSADDASGNGNMGTLTGSPAWTAASSCKKGDCITFDGTDDYINIPDNSEINPAHMSISAWFYASEINFASQPYPTVMKKENGGAYYTIEICTHDGGASCNSGTNDKEVAFAFYNGSGINPGYYTQQITLNTWYFVAGTYDGTTAKLYINGTEVSSTTTSGNIVTNTSPLTIGRDPNLGRFFDGRIDEVRVYDRGLTAAEILALYNATK